MSYSLGIDIGTSKIAVVIMDSTTRQILDCSSIKTEAEIAAVQAGFAEQDVEKIIQTLYKAVSSFSSDLRRQVTAIGVTGQMHGVMLWNDKTTSPLYTWQDKRASTTGMLEHIRRVSGCEKLQDGYGTVTLAWLAANEALSGWQYAATIHDYAVSRFCGLEHPVSDAADAASWGLFDIYSGRWDNEAIKRLKIPEKFFPEAVKCGSAAGLLSDITAAELGLPPGIPVTVATGDNQAAILATSSDPERELYLTIGTGAQLSAILSRNEINSIDIPASAEIRPYNDDSFLVVAAALSGGQSMLWMTDMLNSWMRDLGLPELSRDELFTRLDKLAVQSTDATLDFKPNFNGERHNPALSGSIDNIREGNFTLANVFRSLAGGVLKNLAAMMPGKVWQTKQCVLANGNAVRNLEIIKQLIPVVFGMPVRILNSSEEAACGAAILSIKSNL